MAAVPRTGLRERGRSRPWYRRLTALKTIKIRPVRPLMTNCKTTVRADCSFFVELPPSASEISSSLRWLCVGSLPWTGVQSLSPPPWLCMLSVQAQSFRLCATSWTSPPGSSVHGILQTRILEWVAMPSSRGSSRPRDRTRVSSVSCIGRQILYP